MPLSDHVSLTITVDSVGVTRAGFGKPLILSHNASFPERVRFYSSTAELADDGFDSDSPEYRAVSAFLGQNPRPEQVAIGRASTSVIQQYTIDAGTARNSEAYSIEVKGEGFDDDTAEYTSDAAATVAEIHNGLVTALNAVTDNNYLAEFAPLVFADDTFTASGAVLSATAHGLLTGDGPFQLTSSGTLPANLALATNYWAIKLDADTFSLATSLANALAGTAITTGDAGTGTHTISDTASTVRPDDPFTVTGDATGDWFSLEVYDPGALKISQTHSASGLSTELDAILLEDSSWYEVHTLYNSTAYALAVAAWAEANERIYVLDVNDTDAITVAEASGTDTLKQLFDLGYANTMYSYHPNPAAMFSAAWMGRWLPTDPGKATTKFKTLSGVEAVSLSTTHRNNLVARRANSYQTIAGRNITWEGTVGSTTNRFLDMTRNLHWLKDEFSKVVYETMAGADIVPYTAQGIAQIAGALRGSATGKAVAQGVLSDDPLPVVTAPKITDVDAADKSDRVLRNVKVNGTAQGGLHKVVVTASVSF